MNESRPKTARNPRKRPVYHRVFSYTYNALNQLTAVSMPRPQGTQTRTFAYTGADMTSATNPENGTVTYTYDNAHHVTSRTDAKGQQTQYTYDTYGRLTEAQHFPTPGNEDVTQRVTYAYDQGQYGLGRLTGVQFGLNDMYSYVTQNAPPFSYAYSYNVAGRIISQSMVTTGPAGLNMTAAYQWDTEGRMAQVTYPSVTWPLWYIPVPTPPIYAMQYDTMGRLVGMTEDKQDGNGPQAVASAGYGAGGQILSLSYFGVSETRQYNSLLQLTRMTATGGTTLMDMQYNYSSTQNNGRIVSSNDYVTGENVTYGYDALNRLTSASAASLWSETYNYDGFGNLTAKNVLEGPAPVLGVSYDVHNHQLGLQYDANGNQMADAQNANTYTWNVENRLATETSNGWPGAETWYSYDPWGRRVMADANADPWGENGGPGYEGGAWQYYFYGITGQKLMTVNCVFIGSQVSCWWGGYNKYFGGKLVENGGGQDSNGNWRNQLPVVTDRLGSVRATWNWQGFQAISYFPFGEERTSTPDGTEKYGTYFRDGPGQDYAEQRYYNNGTGRFWSVDPGGIKAADRTTPFSWNRYLYGLADPVNSFDPTGRIACDPNGDDGCYSNDNGDDCDGGDVCVDDSDGGGDGQWVYDTGAIVNGTLTFSVTGTGTSSSSDTTTTIWSASFTWGLTELGAGIGEMLGGLGGAFSGAIFGSMCGAGPTGAYVPRTGSVYFGLTVVCGASPGAGYGPQVTRTRVTGGQNPNKIAGGFSSTVTFQPTIITGTTVTKSPGSSPVVGSSVGTRVPVSGGVGYNICLLNCKK
jgi:RHS repeat-associated protein